MPFYIRRRILILSLITAAGGIARLATLDRPPIWGDEALTYSRVIGSFPEMMQILRNDGFMPLHYILYWCMAQFVELTPRMMRLIPALCGTAMIPAMYFATRQLASVRASLLAAGFAAASAYLMAYSHDAKMYMQTWLFVALNLGCFWWWLGRGGYIAWALWIVTGLIAVGFHISAALIIAPQPIFLLTGGRIGWKKPALMLCGLLVIAAAPYLYYTSFNRWIDNTGGLLPAQAADAKARRADWANSGVSWVEQHNQGATGPTLLRETASAYLVGAEWAEPRRHRIDTRVTWLVATAFSTTLAFLALGALPWRNPAPTQAADPPAQPWWRVALWLALLLIVPVYGFFYCRSVNDFASPIDWLRAFRIVLPALPFAGLALWYFSGHTFRERNIKLIQFIAVVAGLFLLCIAIHAFWQYQYDRHWDSMRRTYGSYVNRAVAPDLDWQSLWMPRYIGIVWPAVGIAAAVLLARLPVWWLRWPAIATLLAVNLTYASLRLFAGTQPPHEDVFADLKQARDSNHETRVIMTSLDPHQRGVVVWFHASNYGLYGDAGRYYACLMLGLRPTPVEFRSGQIVSQYHAIAGQLTEPSQLRGIASRGRALRLIVWERYTEAIPRPEPSDPPDAVVTQLGNGWKLAAEPKVYPLRSWYEWSDMGWMRRREFVRVDETAVR